MATKTAKAGAEPRGADRRGAERFAVKDMKVDLQSEEAFLFAYVENISEMGIFVAAAQPLPLGSKLTLRFPARGDVGPLTLSGIVRWINPPRGRHPGMGIAFESLTPAQREKVVALVRAVAYLTRN
ncbi:MAG: PilZ domain-containing protein [Deltaproteobacteria bacterium]|nr:PilZ domain-containing protein [Deltaproteobacteria bacterium]